MASTSSLSGTELVGVGLPILHNTSETPYVPRNELLNVKTLKQSRFIRSVYISGEAARCQNDLIESLRHCSVIFENIAQSVGARVAPHTWGVINTNEHPFGQAIDRLPEPFPSNLALGAVVDVVRNRSVMSAQQRAGTESLSAKQPIENDLFWKNPFSEEAGRDQFVNGTIGSNSGLWLVDIDLMFW